MLPPVYYFNPLIAISGSADYKNQYYQSILLSVINQSDNVILNGTPGFIL